MRKLFFSCMIAMAMAFPVRAQTVPEVPAYTGTVTPVEGRIFLTLGAHPRSLLQQTQRTSQLTQSGWEEYTQQTESYTTSTSAGGDMGDADFRNLVEMQKVVINGQLQPFDFILKIGMSQWGEAKSVEVSSPSTPAVPDEVQKSFENSILSIKGSLPREGLTQDGKIYQATAAGGMTIRVVKTLKGMTEFKNRKAAVLEVESRSDNGVVSIRGYELMDLDTAVTLRSELLSVAESQGQLLLVTQEFNELDVSGW